MPPTKRKATSPARPVPAQKRLTTTTTTSNDSPNTSPTKNDEEPQNEIIQRQFYPPEISSSRCAQYNSNSLSRPIEVLQTSLSKSTLRAKAGREGGACVLHWFKRDLRLTDNRALSAASLCAQKLGIPLIAIYIISPQDDQAHLKSSVKVDFELRSLEVLKKDLGERDIPLWTEIVEERKEVVEVLLGKCREWGAREVFCNMEYEVDELRREAELVKKGGEEGVKVEVMHDDVVVPPGKLRSGSGKQYAVYSPWYRAWVKHLHEHPYLLEESPVPSQNPPSTRKTFSHLFNIPIPAAPPNKSLAKEDREKFLHLWPAGEHAAHQRLTHYLTTKIQTYKDTRNFPSQNSTSLLSVHFSTGTLSARTAIRSARNANSTHKLDSGNQGITTWISEIAWRDFYKHVLVHWPYICMHKPFKVETAEIQWDYNPEYFRAWCEGRTGFPIVDAAMRQLNSIGWMHNRLRMVVGSFLSKDLLLDWRLGERYFMEKLIDGDFASNNGGWGFSASVGVDPQPYFRIFNPVLQSEKFDAEGEFIRKWVRELKGVEGKAVHDPYGRGAGKEAERKGYPKGIVVHKEARERALERYKRGLGKDKEDVERKAELK